MFRNFNLLKFVWQQRQRQSFSKSVWNLLSVKLPVKTNFNLLKFVWQQRQRQSLKSTVSNNLLNWNFNLLKFHFLLEIHLFKMLKIQLSLDQLKEWINKFQTTRHTHTTTARSSSFPLGFGDIKASCSTISPYLMKINPWFACDVLVMFCLNLAVPAKHNLCMY